MLEQMRKGSKHPIVKGLFFLLALSFVFWGVGDIFRNNSSLGYAVTVGKSGITSGELDSVVRSEIARYQEVTGKTISEEEAEKIGVRKYAISQLVRDKVLTMSAEDMKLAGGKNNIAKQIYANEAFFDANGKFDKERYKSILKANGLTEDKYVSAINREIAVNTLMESLTTSSVLPDAVVKNVFIFKNELREADIITLSSDSINSVPVPSETDLVKYYNENQNFFAAPERRTISYLAFNIGKIKNNIKFSEEELLAEYQHSISQYKTEESRNVQQFLFPTEEEAKLAYSKISKGDTKGFTGSAIELGNITKSSIPAEVKDAIFSMQNGEVSKPLNSSLGWHIFIVKSIESEKTKSFAEVRRDIEKEMLSKKSSDEFSKFGNQVEDEFASGKTMEEVSTKFDIAIHKIESVDKDGNVINGGKAGIQDPTVLLPLAFGLEKGAHSALTLLSDNASYVIIRVDAIVPSRIKALDEVRGIAIKMYQDQNKIKLLKEKATELASKIKAGEDINILKNKMKVKINASRLLKRPSASENAEGKEGEPAMLTREIFNLQNIGDVTGAYRNFAGDFVIAKLKNIIKTDAGQNKNGYRNLQSELEEGVREDIIAQYIGHLQKKYPVAIQDDFGGGK